MEQTVEILRELVDERRDVTLLTNFSADTFAEACRRFDFLNVTRGATVSGLVGHIKPEREIYDLHSQTFGLEPSATLFIDDNAGNVEGAIAAGWQSVRFADAATLKRDLERFGVAS
jgi:2-haloacid dehalogenase